MDGIASFLKHPKKPPQKKRRTEKGDLYDYFLSHLNPDRAKAGFPPISHSRLAYMFQGMNTQDLHATKSMFDDRVKRNGTPAACKWLWWSLKEKVEDQ